MDGLVNRSELSGRVQRFSNMMKFVSIEFSWMMIHYKFRIYRERVEGCRT